METITGNEEYIDSRDILARIEELTTEFLMGVESDELDVEDSDMSAEDWMFVLTQEDAEELYGLIQFREENVGTFGDSFSGGVILIHEDCFTDYVRELASDWGYLPKDFPSWIVINWEETADNVRVDYTEVELFGQSYLGR